MEQHLEFKVDSPYLKDNYRKFLSEPLKIGFVTQFKEKPDSTIVSLMIHEKCMGVDVNFEVRYCWLTFGENDEYEVQGIVTDKIDINSKLPLHGWNSYSHVDAGKLMEHAIILLAAKENLIISNKVCSWPFAKAVVTGMTDAHEQAYEITK